MNTGHYLPRTFLLACLLAGSSYAMAQAISTTPPPAIVANQVLSAATATDHLKIRQLIARQAQAWEKQDFSIAAGDWLPTAQLVSPGGQMTTSQLPDAIRDYFKHFRDMHVTVKDVFTSADERRVAIEWDWDVTRKRDGVRQVSHDAIIVELRGDKIASWREYFDLGNSIDARP